MKKVTGLGGIFFKCEDRERMREWYDKHLGIDAGQYGTQFFWRELDEPEKTGYTVWSPFRGDTNYFDPSTKPFMVNYRVADLDALLEELRKDGVWIDEKREDSEFGRFAWIMDPEGNRLELWEPPEEKKPLP